MLQPLVVPSVAQTAAEADTFAAGYIRRVDFLPTRNPMQTTARRKANLKIVTPKQLHFQRIISTRHLVVVVRLTAIADSNFLNVNSGRSVRCTRACIARERVTQKGS
jgi:hypothetical protein